MKQSQTQTLLVSSCLYTTLYYIIHQKFYTSWEFFYTSSACGFLHPPPHPPSRCHNTPDMAVGDQRGESLKIKCIHLSKLPVPRNFFLISDHHRRVWWGGIFYDSSKFGAVDLVYCLWVGSSCLATSHNYHTYWSI